MYFLSVGGRDKRAEPEVEQVVRADLPEYAWIFVFNGEGICSIGGTLEEIRSKARRAPANSFRVTR